MAQLASIANNGIKIAQLLKLAGVILVAVLSQKSTF
jgi:ribosome-associated protein YbcJ (S4-like RNA binding protein)